MATETPKREDRVLPHRLELEGRRRLTVTGVGEVLRFDEALVVLRAAGQLLVVHGEGLTLRQLAPQEGRVELRGLVESLGYEQPARGKGLLRRLLG